MKHEQMNGFGELLECLERRHVGQRGSATWYDCKHAEQLSSVVNLAMLLHHRIRADQVSSAALRMSPTFARTAEPFASLAAAQGPLSGDRFRSDREFPDLGNIDNVFVFDATAGLTASPSD